MPSCLYLFTRLVAFSCPTSVIMAKKKTGGGAGAGKDRAEPEQSKGKAGRNNRGGAASPAPWNSEPQDDPNDLLDGLLADAGAGQNGEEQNQDSTSNPLKTEGTTGDTDPSAAAGGEDPTATTTSATVDPVVDSQDSSSLFQSTSPVFGKTGVSVSVQLVRTSTSLSQGHCHLRFAVPILRRQCRRNS